LKPEETTAYLTYSTGARASAAPPSMRRPCVHCTHRTRHTLAGEHTRAHTSTHMHAASQRTASLASPTGSAQVRWRTSCEHEASSAPLTEGTGGGVMMQEPAGQGHSSASAGG
jgi:hypothetical protein